MKNYPLICLVAYLFLTISCRHDDNIDDMAQEGSINLNAKLSDAILTASNGLGKAFFELPDPGDWESIPQDPLNPITNEKVELGKLLFHETGLGINPNLSLGKETYSCASCHFASAGFQACRQQGIGEGGVGFAFNGAHRTLGALYNEENADIQPIRTPTAMNGAYQEVMLWNGQFGAQGVNEGTQASWTAETPKENNFLGFQGLEIQAIAGLGVHRLGISDYVLDELNYRPLFDEAFSNDDAQERYSLVNAGLAIAAYERTILSNQAPFQKWLKGDLEAMSPKEIEGAILFFGKANCSNCHTGPALNKMDFAAIGLKDLYECDLDVLKTSAEDLENKGRGGFTGRAAEEYKFKIPQLYNLKDSPFYGHGSSMTSIREVIAYKNKALAENLNVPSSQLSEEFVPLHLNEEEIDALVIFLERSLKDPNLSRYEPEHVLSGNCIPVNDVLSSHQLGCH